MEHIVPWLPHVNATLNTIATLLLVWGYLLIKRRGPAAAKLEHKLPAAELTATERWHRNVMLACFGVSTVFLASYLTYHFNIEGSKRFPAYPPLVIRYSYYAILLSHVLLAITVPFLAITTIYAGLKMQRERHRFWAKITFPIWLYVSVTGVIVYLMLYQIFPSQ